jgi:NAD(P)-dependent dehydrogenase (short-subunit alcohol dehydrogenase family)/rhamnose utilization protein RhaD (predicted bifunctional aldolase and dehydrogenase)
MDIPWIFPGNLPPCEGNVDIAYGIEFLEQNKPYLGSCFQVSEKKPSLNIFNEAEEVLTLSPARLLTLGGERQGITRLNIHALKKILQLESLAAAQLVRRLALARMEPDDPCPSTDALTHAVLPFQAIVFVQPPRLAAVFSSEVLYKQFLARTGNISRLIEYVSPGLPLAKNCWKAVHQEADGLEQIKSLAVRGYGMFIFGQSLYQALTHLMYLLELAMDFTAPAYGIQGKSLGLVQKKPGPVMGDKEASQAHAGHTGHEIALRGRLARLRQQVSDLAGRPLVLSCQALGQPLAEWQEKGGRPAERFPIFLADSVMVDQFIPMVGEDFQAYMDDYAQFIGVSASSLPQVSPRIILDPTLGLCSLGESASGALLARNLFLENLEISFALAQIACQPLSAGDICQHEQQRNEEWLSVKVLEGRGAGRPLFQGETALVTGGASGIGKACVEALLAQGACVTSLDINPAVTQLFQNPEYLGLACDLTDEAQVITCFETLVRTFGGLDMLVLNAGVFPAGCRIEAMNMPEWQRVMRINLDANLVVLVEAYPLLKTSPKGGRVLVNASKNVLAPGAGAAAYSSSKAGLTQMARVAALEWGKDHIRVNIIHPDAVFDTGIWSDEVIQARAAHYGLTVQQYKTRNILGVELNSRYVASLAVDLLGPNFEKITGAQIPVDGGSDRVI